LREDLSSSPYQQKNLTYWPTFRYSNSVFSFANNIFNFDLIPFLEDVNSTFNLNNLSISEVRAGFAFYYGSGNFSFNNFDVLTEFELTANEFQN
jgi:hypothetical protein